MLFMSAIAHKPAAFELRLPRDAAKRDRSGHTLMLKPSADGWSLIGPDGEVLFRGLGTAARRECLQRARELGVLTVVS
jgi:hypothetical protein